VDTEKCDGCGDCVPACSEGVLEVAEDDFDERKARVKHELAQILAHACLGYHAFCERETSNCHAACHAAAIEHSW